MGVGGVASYDLSMLTMPETYVDGELDDYIDPSSEFLRVLDPNSSLTTAKYCYVSKGFLDDNVDEPEDAEWAIGWWNYENGVDYAEVINEGDSTLQIKGAVTISNGMAFLGNFSAGHSMQLVSNGEVPTVVSQFETDQNSAPAFINYLPVDLKLSDLTVADIRDEEGELEDYCDPSSEFIRVLDPNSSLTTAKYCYVSYGFLEDNVDEPDDCLWAIGWWNYENGVDYAEVIGEGDDSLKLKADVNIPSGSGFLGNFSAGHSLDITFPSALEVPSNAK